MQRLLIPVLSVLVGVAAAAPTAVPVSPATTAPPDAKRILDAFHQARPPDGDLGVFRLDWAASLKEARARAAKEKRPIFFVSTMQLKDAGDLKGGHC